MKQIDSALLLDVVREAATAWDLSIAQIKLISRSENIVFRLDTEAGEPYVLRLHRPGYHTLAELNSEQEWTAALNQAGLGVPVPKMTRNGHGYTSVSIPGTDESRYVGLAEWFEGVPLGDLLDAPTDGEDKKDAEIKDQYFEQIGRIAAKIHNQATSWQLPPGFQRHAFDADGFMGESPFWGPFWHLPQLTEGERKCILRARRKIHHILSDYGKMPNTYSLIHADLHPYNLLLHGDRLHVIDFDDSGFGWHQYELAVALYNYLDAPDFDRIQAALISGYRAERTLTDETIALIPLFFLIRTLAIIGWTYARPELGWEGRIPRLIALACEQADTLFGSAEVLSTKIPKPASDRAEHSSDR